MTDYDASCLINIDSHSQLVPDRLPGTIYGVGEKVHNKWTGYNYTALNAGMSAYGSSGDYLPWPTLQGASTLDGTIVWVCDGFPYKPKPDESYIPILLGTLVDPCSCTQCMESEVIDPLLEEREI